MSDSNPSETDPFGQIADEFVEAFRQGKHPSVEEFAQRYPEHAGEIREVLPALVLMEKAKSADDSSDPLQEARRTAAPSLRQLGDYEILREVGRGGMGVVYEAQQLSLGRHVAIKVLPSHALLDPRHLGRFQREARSAAKLHHTNIVPVFGVGEQDGLHYYVMQFIQGLGLDVVLDELRRLRQPRGKQALTLGETAGRPTNVARDISAVHVAHGLLSGAFRKPQSTGTQTLAAGKPDENEDKGNGTAAEQRQPIPSDPFPSSLSSSATIHLPGQSDTSTLSESGRQYWQSVARVGMQVADALAHAASQGILHRDIKPSNLLLDDTGNVWVTDFGLAKAASDSDDLTHTGDLVGTLRYMAPERFNGQGDLRSDVYSLGLTLYEMLALRPAFDEADRNRLVKRVMHDEPVRPRKLNPSVPRDLETVVLKAIARDPAHRYQTPAAMAEDLKRFIEDRPVKARRVGELEKFMRWCRRNPLPATLLAAIVLVFLTGFAGVVWQWRAALAARENEKAQRGRAQALQKDAETARDDAKDSRNAAAQQAAGLLLDRGIEDARGGEPARALHLFVQALQALAPDDSQAAPLERVIRMNLSAWAETVPALEHIFAAGPHFDHIAYSHDGNMLAMAVGQGEVQCFRTDTGQPAGPPITVPIGLASALAFAPDGRSLWVASPGYEKVVDHWAIHRLDPVSGRPIQSPILSTGPVPSLVVTPDGHYLVGKVLGLHPEDRGPKPDASGTRRWQTASFVIWETATGKVIREVKVNSGFDYTGDPGLFDTYMSLSPDGKSVTSWIEHGSSRYEQMSFTVTGHETPSRVELPSLGPVTRPLLHFEHNMRTALVIKDGQLHRWAATNPGVLGLGVLTPFASMYESQSADGRSVASLDGQVFDTGAWPPRPTGVHFAHPGLQHNRNACLEQSPDGRFETTWLWQPGGGGRVWRLPHPHSRPALPFSELARQPRRAYYQHNAVFAPRGTSAVLWSIQLEQDDLWPGVERYVRLVDVATGAMRPTSVRHADRVREVVFSPDGRHFATASFDATARVWDTAAGRPAGPPLRHTNYVSTVAFSPDGNVLAAGDYGPAGLIRFWDWRTGKEVRPPLHHNDIVTEISWSPDGQYLAAIKLNDWSHKPEFLVWDVASGTAVLRTPYLSWSYLVREPPRFRPDGRAVAARDFKGVLRLWEIPTGKLLGERPLDGEGAMCFSPDGRVVAAAANLGVRLLDGHTLAPLKAGYLPLPDPIRDLAFSPDGTSLLTAQDTGSAQLWDVATRKPVGPPAVLIGPIRAVSFTPDGKTCLCVAADGTVRRWPVPSPFAEPDLARLDDRIALMTGQRMDENQGLDSVPTAEWLALRTKLVGDGSTALVPPRPDADWHDAAAADAEQDGDAYGAQWHLDRLAKLRPNDWTIPARLGRVLAHAGRNQEAAAAYAHAARLVRSPRDLADWLRAAAVDDEATKRYDLALWSLERAVKLTPDDWTLYAARASLAHQAGQQDRVHSDIDQVIRRRPDDVATVAVLAELAGGSGDWKRAGALFAHLAHFSAVPTDIRYEQALAFLKVGNLAGYQAACAEIAKPVPPVGPKLSSGVAYDSALGFTLGPNASNDLIKPLAWMDHALAHLRTYEKAHPERKEGLRREFHLFLTAHGALSYRAGRFAEAVEDQRAALPYHSRGGDYHNWLFLALAEHRLGHADAAKQAAAKARAALAGPKPDSVWERAEMELLSVELNTALPASGTARR